MKILPWVLCIALWIVVAYLAFGQTPTPSPKPFPCKPSASGQCTGQTIFTCTQKEDFQCARLPEGDYSCTAIFSCEDGCVTAAAKFPKAVRQAKIDACRSFSLMPYSPAIGAGDPKNCPKTDFMGRKRPAGSCNAGAF